MAAPKTLKAPLIQMGSCAVEQTTEGTRELHAEVPPCYKNAYYRRNPGSGSLLQLLALPKRLSCFAPHAWMR
jgi:hypothetical protein